MGTFLHKAIPDTRMTIGRYADAKFEYLSYCLKVPYKTIFGYKWIRRTFIDNLMNQVKEMDDEEQSYHSLQEPSYRIETGNYEYRYKMEYVANRHATFWFIDWVYVTQIGSSMSARCQGSIRSSTVWCSGEQNFIVLIMFQSNRKTAEI